MVHWECFKSSFDLVYMYVVHLRTYKRGGSILRLFTTVDFGTCINTSSENTKQRKRTSHNNYTLSVW